MLQRDCKATFEEYLFKSWLLKITLHHTYKHNLHGTLAYNCVHVNNHNHLPPTFVFAASNNTNDGLSDLQVFFKAGALFSKYNFACQLFYLLQFGNAGEPKACLIQVNWSDQYPTILPAFSLDNFFNNHMCVNIINQLTWLMF